MFMEALEYARDAVRTLPDLLAASDLSPTAKATVKTSLERAALHLRRAQGKAEAPTPDAPAVPEPKPGVVTGGARPLGREPRPKSQGMTKENPAPSPGTVTVAQPREEVVGEVVEVAPAELDDDAQPSGYGDDVPPEE